MKILLSNDDGYQAPGLTALAKHISSVSEVVVVAPEGNRSGASSSLSLQTPLTCRVADNGFMYMDGSPADCVHMAITGMLDEVPDMVIAGINHGDNLADDVLYSGTVAAAIEGRFLGAPSIAVSLVGGNPVNFDSAAQVTLSVLDHLNNKPLDKDTILNINVPDLPLSKIKGIKPTRMGRRHQSEPIVTDSSNVELIKYMIGPYGAQKDNSPGTDFEAVNNGYVSVTPLQIDLTHHQQIDHLHGWMTDLTLNQ